MQVGNGNIIVVVLRYYKCKSIMFTSKREISNVNRIFMQHTVELVN